MSNLGVRRLIWIYCGTCALFIIWIGVVLESLTENRTTAAESIEKVGAYDSPPEKLEVVGRQSAFKTRYSQPLVLPVQAGINRWVLPIENHRNGWLICVGSVTTRNALKPVRLKAKAIGSDLRDEDAEPQFEPLDSNLSKHNDFPKKHFVARSRNLVNSLKTEITQENDKKLLGQSAGFMIQTRTGPSEDPASYELIQAKVAVVGERVLVYVDDRDRAHVKKEIMDAIVAIMDRDIPEKVVPKIGEALDTDGDGRIRIVMTQALSRMADGTVSLDGFVRPMDFDSQGKLPLSHASDVVYINSKVADVAYLKSLLAHEFTHAVTASARMAYAGQSWNEEESWLEEGIAHLSERWVDGSWRNLDYRVSAYYQQPESHQLIVNDQVGLSSSRAHGHRGASFLFLSWCESVFGTEIASRLIHSNYTGIQNLEQATGVKFETLFRAWSVELMRDQQCRESLGEVQRRALLDDWLAGIPRSTEIHVENQPSEFQWQPLGTTLRFFEIEPLDLQNPRGAIELQFEADSAAAFQVTAIPLTDRHKGVEISVEEIPGRAQTLAEKQVQLVVRNRDQERSLKLQAASWEVISPSADAHLIRENHRIFDLLTVARWLGTNRLSPGQRLVSQPIPLNLAGPAFSTGKLAWKMVAHDESGTPLFGSATVEIQSQTLSVPDIARSLGVENAGGVKK